MRRWFVLAGCAVVSVVSVGPSFIVSFGIYMVPMTRALGWSRTQFSFLFFLTSTSIGAMALFGGHIIKRYGTRKLIWIAIVGVPAMYASYGLVHSYLVATAIAVGAGLVGMYSGYVLLFAVLTRWFDRHLGLAVGVIAASTSVGAMLFPPMVTYIVGIFSWRSAFFLIALIMLVVGALSAAVLIRENPGPLPEPERRKSVSSSDDEANATSGASFKEAVYGGAFWSFVIGFSLIALISYGINLHLPAMLHDRGFTPMQGASALATLAAAMMISRFVGGILLDHFQPRYLALVFFVGQAVAALLLLSKAGGAIPWIAAILLGCASGIDGDLIPYCMRRRFGAKNFAPIFSTAYAVWNLGQALGGPVLGMVYDRVGSYGPLLAVFPVFSLIAVAAVFFTKVEPPAAVPRVVGETTGSR